MAKTVPPKTPEAYVVKYPHLLNEHWTIDQINAHADAALEYFRKNKEETSISKYFTSCNIPRKYIQRWSEKSKYFAAIVDILKSEQCDRLSDMLPSKEYATSGVIFTLKNVSDWRDQPAVETESDEFTLIDNWNK